MEISLSNRELEHFRGKDLVIVEDIVVAKIDQDTGNTMVALMDLLSAYKPASVTVVSLLVKRHGKEMKFKPDFVGFSIPDVFVVGYGLDYNEFFRDLQPIAVINQSGIKKYSMT